MNPTAIPRTAPAVMVATSVDLKFTIPLLLLLLRSAAAVRGGCSSIPKGSTMAGAALGEARGGRRASVPGGTGRAGDRNIASGYCSLSHVTLVGRFVPKLSEARAESEWTS